MGRKECRRVLIKADRNATQRDQNIKRHALNAKRLKEVAEKSEAHKAALADPGFEIPESIEVTTSYLDDVRKRLYYNDDIADYYIRLADEYNMPNLYNVAFAVKNCHKHWFGDWYGLQRVYDRKSLSLCHDKFCSNCNHLKQASRLKRFAPVLEELRQTYDLYHCVLTIPNCPGEKLKSILDRFADAAKQVLRYFRGNAKIAGVNFVQYGYVGALRSLEIVVNPMDYHPHYHCLLVLKKDLPLYKLTVNKYSFKNGRFEPEKFSELEVLVQKILYLAYNKQRVTLDAIESVPIGYSCKIDKADGDEWHEVFKYVTKITKDSMTVLDYNQFKTLFFALFRRRTFQGYGCLYQIAKDDSIDTEVAKAYARIIAQLQLVEIPVERAYELEDLSNDLQKGHIRVITKGAIQKWLNELAVEDDD